METEECRHSVPPLPSLTSSYQVKASRNSAPKFGEGRAIRGSVPAHDPEWPSPALCSSRLPEGDGGPCPRRLKCESRRQTFLGLEVAEDNRCQNTQ